MGTPQSHINCPAWALLSHPSSAPHGHPSITQHLPHMGTPLSHINCPAWAPLSHTSNAPRGLPSVTHQLFCMGPLGHPPTFPQSLLAVLQGHPSIYHATPYECLSISFQWLCRHLSVSPWLPPIGSHPPPDTPPGRYSVPHSDYTCLLYTSPSPRDGLLSRMPSSA